MAGMVLLRNLSYAEIAAIMHTAPRIVEGQIRTALKMLRLGSATGSDRGDIATPRAFQCMNAAQRSVHGSLVPRFASVLRVKHGGGVHRV